MRANLFENTLAYASSPILYNLTYPAIPSSGSCKASIRNANLNTFSPFPFDAAAWERDKGLIRATPTARKQNDMEPG